MDQHNTDVDVGRRKAAVDYLHRMLERRGITPFQQAEEIANLVHDRSNPVSILFFSAADTRPSSARPSTAHQSDGFKSSISKLLRRDNKSTHSDGKASDSQAEGHDPNLLFTEMFGDPTLQNHSSRKPRSRSVVRVGSYRAPVRPAHQGSTGPSPSVTGKPSTAYQYKCIICEESLSSKGVCKRHLDDQHIRPTVWRCEKCQKTFRVKKEGKLHGRKCGQGIFKMDDTKLESKKFYACEFTGKHFASKSPYLEHLLSLSERTEDRPKADLRLKLNTILQHTALKDYADEVSSVMFGSPSEWQRLQWGNAQLAKIVAELDDATVQDNGFIGFAGSDERPALDYLNEVFRAAILPRSNSQQSRRSRSSTVTQRQAPIEPHDRNNTPVQYAQSAMPPPSGPPILSEISTTDNGVAAPGSSTPSISAEVRSKRHLSDQSRAYEPDRQPPGPPLVGPMTYGIGPAMPDLHYNLPNHNSTSTLPFRPQESSQMVDHMTADMYSTRASSIATPTLTSDGASEYTMVSNYHEPEFDQMTLDSYYQSSWPDQQQQISHNFYGYPDGHSNNGSVDYSVAASEMLYANSGPSTRTSSIITDQTYVGDQSEYNHKFGSFDATLHTPARYGPTFFLDGGDDDLHDSHGMN